MPIHAITFDFWKTLFQDNHGTERQQIRIDALAGATGAGRDEILEASKTVWLRFDRVHREEQRTLGPQDAVRMVAETLGVEISPDAVSEIAEIYATAIVKIPPEPVEGAIEAVRMTAEKYPIGLISDTATSPGRALRKVLDKYGIEKHFKTLTFSDEVGVSKPQAEMFHRTAAGMGFEMGEILHIGDLEYTDVAGAHGAGGTAALFAGYNAEFLNNTKADHTFLSWEEYLETLPEMG